MSEELQALLEEHAGDLDPDRRKAFLTLATALLELQVEDRLLPGPEDPQTSLADRLAALTPADLDNALGGSRGPVLLTREEHQDLLERLCRFLKAFIGPALADDSIGVGRDG